jgi:8-oxo-dGTP diphosphatase
MSFSGAKIALLCGEDLVTFRRDDKPEIPFPDRWDFAGGGREGAETPQDCALRELQEEFGLTLGHDRILWATSYDEGPLGGWLVHFYVAEITPGEVEAIQFGDEGQYWTLMKIADFLSMSEAVPYLQQGLRAYLKERPDMAK